MEEYLLRMLTFVSIWSILIVSLNLQIGYTGLLSIAQAAFWGIGAYAYAILSKNYGIDFITSTVIAMVISGIAGALVALPSLRLRGIYFLIATLGFQLSAYGVMQNWIDVTRGPMGFYGIPKPVIFGTTVSASTSLFLLSALIAIVAIVLAYRLGRSPFGRALKAIREDELAAAAVGKSIRNFKVLVFIFSALLASAAGSLFSAYISAIDPFAFHVRNSLLMIAIVIIGGAGNIKGSIAGTILFLGVPELLRFIDIPSVYAGQIRELIFGALLVLVIMFRPRGLMGEYEFR